MLRGPWFLIFVLVLAAAGCRKASLENIDGWITSGQFRKVSAFVVNTEIPLPDRVKAIEKLVDTGQTLALQEVFGELTDRDAVVKETQTVLLKRLAADTAQADVKAKDALFIILKYMEEPDRDQVRAAVAAWGFRGLSAASPQELLLKQVERLQLIGQMGEVGQYAVPVAAWMIAYGIETNTLTPFLARHATTPELQREVLKAVKRLIQLPDLAPPWELVDVARRFPLPETVDLLVEIYLKDTFEGGFRSSSLRAAQDLIAGESFDGKPTTSIHDTPEKRASVLTAVGRLMASKTATDRWDAADMMFSIAGVDALDAVLSGFKADITLYSSFTPDEETWLPDYTIGDMCKRRIVPSADEARPILERWLAKGDRMQKAFSALCLKMIGSQQSVPHLQTLVADPTKLEDIFFPGGNPTRKDAIANGTLTELTVGSLAQNAIEGIQMLQETTAARAAKTMSHADADLKNEVVLAVFAYTGENYKLAVQLAFERKRKGEAGDANDAPPPAAPPVVPPGGAVPGVPPAAPGPAPK